MMSVTASRTLLREILQSARERHGGSCRAFADAINQYYGYELTGKDSVNRLEVRGAISSSDVRLLALMAPFTNYSAQELLRISAGDASADLIQRPSGLTMQVQLQKGQLMSESSQDLPKFPSLIAGFLEQLVQEGKLDRDGIAAALGMGRDRVNLLIERKIQITEGEYAAIATLINQHLGGNWSAQSLKESKDFWDFASGNINGDVNGASS